MAHALASRLERSDGLAAAEHRHVVHHEPGDEEERCQQVEEQQPLLKAHAAPP